MNSNTLQPLIEESDGANEDNEEDQDNEWKVVAEKADDIARRTVEYFDDDNGKEAQPPPMIKAPRQPTREEYERHQATHTPYAAWRIHCATARAVRTQHPSKGRNTIIVPDIDRGIIGPTKISMDSMYLHDRGDHKKNEQANPPNLVVVEHKHGRVWAYQVPNKGIMGGSHRLPRWLGSDWDNCGMKEATI